MKAVLFILIAFVGYGVEGIKIRAIRRRWIQYLPNRQISVPQQTQYYRWQSQNQRTPFHGNDRLRYSYLKPDGMRYNMLDGRERYLAYLKNIANIGPNQSINGIAEGQSGLNSEYEAIMGQPTYQNWQEAYSGSPVHISAGYNGVNGIGDGRQSVYQSWQNSGENPAEVSIDQSRIISGLGGIDKSVYHSWQKPAQGDQVDVSSVQTEVGSGHRGHLQFVYNNLQSSDNENADNDNSGGQLGAHNSQSSYQNLQISGSPIDVFSEDNGANSEISAHIYQNVLNSASDRPIDVSVEQSGANSESDADIEQPLYQDLESSHGGDSIDMSSEQREVRPGHITQYLSESWKNSASSGLAGFPTYQDGIVTEDKELTGHPISLINHKLQSSEYQTNDAGDQSTPDSEYSGHVGYSLQHNLQNLGNVEQVGQNSENGGVLSLAVLNDSNNIDNKEDSSQNYDLIGTDTENHSDSPNNEDINLVYQGEPTDNAKSQEVHVNGEENFVPVINGNENYPITDDNGDDKDILIIDQSKLNSPGQTPFKSTPVELLHFGNEENVAPDNIMINFNDRTPISIMPENDLITTHDGIFSVDQSEVTEAPLKEKIHEFNMDNLEKNGPGPIVLGSIPVSPDNLPMFPFTLKQNLQSSVYKPTWNRITTNLQQQPQVLSYKTQYGNVEKDNPMTGHTPIQENSEIQGMCDSSYSNPNSISRGEGNYYGIRVRPLANIQDNEENYYGINVKPLANTQNRINILLNTGKLNPPQNAYEKLQIRQNKKRPHIFNHFQRPSNVAYLKIVANPNLYKKGSFPYYQPDSLNMNTYNYPQPNYYSPTGQKYISMRSDKYKANENPSIDTEDKEVTPNIPDTKLIYKKPYFQQNFEMNNIPGILQPITSTFTTIPKVANGHSKPRDLSLRSKPSQYVYRIKEAIEPELLRLYYSKCQIGHDEKLLKEIKKIIDSIHIEHCQL